MDTILRLYSQDSTGTTLQHYFDESENIHSSEYFLNLVIKCLQEHVPSVNEGSAGPDCLLLIRAILRASPEEGDGIMRRNQVLKGSVIWLINTGDDVAHSGNGVKIAHIDDIAGKLVNVIIDVGQTFDMGGLVESINTMTESVRSQKQPHSQMFTLMSRLLVIATNLDSITLPDSSEVISGTEYRDIVLDRICTAPWNNKVVLPLATTIADIEMESKQLETAIIKIMKQFKQVDATDLPILVYNLLLLSSKGHQRLVLKGTLEFFDRLDAGGALADSLRSDNPKGSARLEFSELSAIESTVILHFSFAVKQDQELGMELLKHIKSGKTAYLSSFSLACLMTMSRIHRFEDSVMDLLKSSISSAYKDMERIQREPWVSNFEGMTPVPIIEMFCDIINKIPYGLEQLTPSLVHCGVYIMDSMAPKSPWATSDKDTIKRSTPKSPNDLGCELGARILAEVFKFDFNLKEGPVLKVKTLESRQVALSGFLLLLVPSPKQQINSRGNSSRSGGQILENDLPGYSIEILGMLRRCLGQQGEIRLSLYIGLMDIIETSSSLNPMIFEILQAQFVHFYDKTGTRLSPLMLEECVGNSKTGGEPVFSEPLHYLMCSVVRSLVSLQKMKRRSSHSRDEIHAADEHQISECHRDLDRILLGLERAGLEDFELDKTSDFNMATNIGARNNMYATLLNGCYESAIEYIILKHQQHAEQPSIHGKGVASESRILIDHNPSSVTLAEGSSELILQLFGKMRKLHDIVKEKVVLPRGKKVGQLGESSVLGLESVTKVMEVMFAERKDGERQDGEALKLRSNDDFVYYISTVVQMLLTKLHTSVDLLKDSEYDYCRRLTSVFVREFLVNERPDGPKALAAGAKGKDKTKSLLMIGIEAITAGLLTVQHFYPTKSPSSQNSAKRTQNSKIVSSFLAATLPQANGGHRPDQQAAEVVAWTTSRTIRSDYDSLSAAYIQYLQGLIVLFVNETIPLLKETSGLLQMIQILSKYLGNGILGSAVGHAVLSRTSSASSMESTGADSSQLDQLVHWLVKFCRDQALDDAALTKTLLYMMLQLEQDCSNPQENIGLLSSPEIGGRGESSSLGFGNVSASSAVSHCPEAAARMRLAADVLLAYGMNYGGPNTPSLRDLPDRVPQGEDVDEDIVRLIQLKKEIGIDPLFAVVTLRTSGAVTEVLLQQVDKSLEGLEWAISKLKYCGLSYSGHAKPILPSISRSISSDIDELNEGKRSVFEFETEICWRIETCVWVLVRIAQSCINQSSSEHLIRVLQRCYRVLTALTKYYLLPVNTSPLNLFSSNNSPSVSGSKSSSKYATNQKKSGNGNSVIQLPHGFLRVTQVAGMELSRYLYTFLSYFQMLDVEQKARAQERGGQKAKKGSKNKEGDEAGSAKSVGGLFGASGSFKSRQKAKILRESKLIPTLIYGVEQYERYVIQLGKKAKVNLTQFMRRSTARDFRIQIQRLGDLGLEDQYDEERQQLAMRREQEQQESQLHGQDGDIHMSDLNENYDETVYEEEDNADEEETLVRSHKRVKREV
ncbi:hypothetical protein BGZ76_009963 [Entomortierella beljakovae]|nr:hypothetical protein BGZ76_009963 [Entomortierella beljakovae]